MRKNTVYIGITMLIIGIVIMSGCVGNGTNAGNAQYNDAGTKTASPANNIPDWGNIYVPEPPAAEYANQPPASETVLATIDSLPSGATVFIQDEENAGKAMDTAGSTPLKVELIKGKKYLILTVFSIDQYRERTRDIPEIQKRLDEFQYYEKTGSFKPGNRYFFETYTKDLQIFRIEGRLNGLGIPIDAYISPAGENNLRFASVFVPLGMNPDVLLPLAEKNKEYVMSKPELISIMKRNNAPDDLVDRTYNLLTKAGVALAVYPSGPSNDGTPQKMAIHFTASDTDSSAKIVSVAVYETVFDNVYNEP